MSSWVCTCTCNTTRISFKIICYQSLLSFLLWIGIVFSLLQFSCTCIFEQFTHSHPGPHVLFPLKHPHLLVAHPLLHEQPFVILDNNIMLCCSTSVVHCMPSCNFIHPLSSGRGIYFTLHSVNLFHMWCSKWWYPVLFCDDSICHHCLHAQLNCTAVPVFPHWSLVFFSRPEQDLVLVLLKDYWRICSS